MHSIEAGEILRACAEASGEPVEEFTTEDLLLRLRRVIAQAYAAGETEDLGAAARELASGILECWPDDRAALVATRAVELLLGRNDARLVYEPQLIISRLQEGIAKRAGLDEALELLAHAVARTPAPKGERAKQARRLFQAPHLEPVEVAIGFVHPITAVAAHLRERELPRLRAAIADALGAAERKLDGRLAFRLEPSHALAMGPPDQDDAEIYESVSRLWLDEVHAVVAVDLAHVSISDGSTHQRLLHHAHGGPGLWIQDPHCSRRGRLGSAWVREAGWDVRHCEDPGKIRPIVFRWLIKRAGRLEWAARTRRDLSLIYEPLQRRLEALWRGLDARGRAAIGSLTGLTDIEIERCVTDVHFLDSLRAWQLDALRERLSYRRSPRSADRGVR